MLFCRFLMGMGSVTFDFGNQELLGRSRINMNQRGTGTLVARTVFFFVFHSFTLLQFQVAGWFPLIFQGFHRLLFAFMPRNEPPSPALLAERCRLLGIHPGPQHRAGNRGRRMRRS